MMQRLAWTILIVIVLAWLGYTVHESKFFQECIASKQSQQINERTDRRFPEFARPYVTRSRVNTECLFSFLYENRDAVTAVATPLLLSSRSHFGGQRGAYCDMAARSKEPTFPAADRSWRMIRTSWPSQSTITERRLQ
jgi:hypothetical protein